jgi:FkbM family methyltransferase
MSSQAPPASQPPLTDAEASLFRAQHGEDRILFEYFGGRRSGYYVEVGAFNGVDLSNTFFFEQIGWEGLLVEPHPDLAALCRRDRPRSTVAACAVVPPGTPPMVSFEVSDGAELYSSLAMGRAQRDQVVRETGTLAVRTIQAEAKTLDRVLEEAGATAVDFMTIDVEGHELGALEGFDIGRWRPRVVILERNEEMPRLGILRYMSRHGYVLGQRTGVNDWYYAATPAAARSPVYLAKLALRHYALPAFKAVVRPVARPVRALLRRAGLRSGRRPDHNSGGG